MSIRTYIIQNSLLKMNGTLGIIMTLYGMVLICLSIILLFSVTHLHKNVCILTQA
jgi:hypothetical protein